MVSSHRNRRGLHGCGGSWGHTTLSVCSMRRGVGIPAPELPGIELRLGTEFWLLLPMFPTGMRFRCASCGITQPLSATANTTESTSSRSVSRARVSSTSETKQYALATIRRSYIANAYRMVRSERVDIEREIRKAGLRGKDLSWERRPSCSGQSLQPKHLGPTLGNDS